MSELPPDEPSIATAGAARIAKPARGGTDPVAERRRAVDRERLPNRRLSETFDFEADGLKYWCSVTKFSDGRIAEVFLSNHKAGCQADDNAKDAAIIISIALQYGVPLETIRRALLRESEDRPSGPIGIALDLIAAEADMSSDSWR